MSLRGDMGVNLLKVKDILTHDQIVKMRENAPRLGEVKTKENEDSDVVLYLKISGGGQDAINDAESEDNSLDISNTIIDQWPESDGIFLRFTVNGLFPQSQVLNNTYRWLFNLDNNEATGYNLAEADISGSDKEISIQIISECPECPLFTQVMFIDHTLSNGSKSIGEANFITENENGFGLFAYRPAEDAVEFVVPPSFIPLIDGILKDINRGVPPENISRRFHNTVIRMAGEAALLRRRHSSVKRVVLEWRLFSE